MSAVSNFVARIDGYREIATMSATLYRPYEPIGHEGERAQSSFLETIVGRRGRLRSLFSQVEAVGSTRTTRGDGRVIVASNRNLWQLVRDRELREDLYYRLNVLPISLPTLRERKADIPDFVRYFVKQFAASMDKTIENVSEETMRSLVRYPWPGNIRELQNYVARGVILSTDGNFESVPPGKGDALRVEISNPTLEDRVRQEILAACQRANWKLGGPRGAAARLGLKRTTLFYKMKRLGVARPADNWQD